MVRERIINGAKCPLTMHDDHTNIRHVTRKSQRSSAKNQQLKKENVKNNEFTQTIYNLKVIIR